MRYFISLFAALVLFTFGQTTFAQNMETGKFTCSYENAGYNLQQGSGERVFSINIKFTKKFNKTPEVFINVNQLDAATTSEKDKETNIRYRVEPSVITKEVMVLKVTTWGDSRIYGLSGSWLAFEEN